MLNEDTARISTEATDDAQVHAKRIADELHSRISDRKMSLRIWSKGDGTVRLYTGFGSEYIEVRPDGTAECSKSRMTWGHIISQVIAR